MGEGIGTGWVRPRVVWLVIHCLVREKISDSNEGKILIDPSQTSSIFASTSELQAKPLWLRRQVSTERGSFYTDSG